MKKANIFTSNTQMMKRSGQSLRRNIPKVLSAGPKWMEKFMIKNGLNKYGDSVNNGLEKFLKAFKKRK